MAPMRTNHRRHSHAHQVLWSIMCSYKYSKNLADATGSPVGVSGYTAHTPTGGAAVLSHRDTPHQKQAMLALPGL